MTLLVTGFGTILVLLAMVVGHGRVISTTIPMPPGIYANGMAPNSITLIWVSGGFQFVTEEFTDWLHMPRDPARDQFGWRFWKLPQVVYLTPRTFAFQLPAWSLLLALWAIPIYNLAHRRHVRRPGRCAYCRFDLRPLPPRQAITCPYCYRTNFRRVADRPPAALPPAPPQGSPT